MKRPRRNPSKDEYVARFWSKVDTTNGPDACWNWQEGTHSFGHGSFWEGKKSIRSHVFAYKCENGPIEAGKIIRHTCDNPRCCNPRHLLSGTHAENVADKVARNRQAKGEHNGNSKLTIDQVAMIRNLHRPYDKEYGTTALSNRLGVTQKVILDIIARRSWKDL
jgi:hypothetical protein